MSDEQEVLARIEKAHDYVARLCRPSAEDGLKWTMHIPARPDSDPDIVIGDALSAAERFVRARLRASTGERIEGVLFTRDGADWHMEYLADDEDAADAKWGEIISAFPDGAQRRVTLLLHPQDGG